MHETQKQLLDLIREGKITGNMSLRSMAEMIGEEGKPQIVKHHLNQLDKRNLILLNLKEGVLKVTKRGYQTAGSKIYYLPIVNDIL